MTTEYRSRGAEGRPEITSVEVSSFTTPGRTYRVYPEHLYCSCPHHVNTGAYCKHLKFVAAPVYTMHHVYRYGRDEYEIRDSEGRSEGFCISFADGYEAIVHDLGGVLGEAGVGGYYGLEAA